LGGGVGGVGAEGRCRGWREGGVGLLVGVREWCVVVGLYWVWGLCGGFWGGWWLGGVLLVVAGVVGRGWVGGVVVFLVGLGWVGLMGCVAGPLGGVVGALSVKLRSKGGGSGRTARLGFPGGVVG